MQNEAPEPCPLCRGSLKPLPQVPTLIIDQDDQGRPALRRASGESGLPEVSDGDLVESLKTALDWVSGKRLVMADVVNAVRTLTLEMAARRGCKWGCADCDERHFLELQRQEGSPQPSLSDALERGKLLGHTAFSVQDLRHASDRRFRSKITDMAIGAGVALLVSLAA